MRKSSGSGIPIALPGGTFALALVLFVLVPIISGCAQEDKDPGFVWLSGPEPETIDPGLVSGEAGGRVARNLFEGLTYYGNEDLRVRPGMARSWDVSSDGIVYTFHLRRARWSDGTPVRAADFVFAWERVLNPATAAKYANMLYVIENAEAYNRGELTDPSFLGFHAANDSTLVVRLRSPCGYFLSLCALPTLLPVPPHVVRTHGQEWIKPEHLVCNGAFTLEQWLLNRKMVFRKNPLYWNARSVRLERAEAIPGENSNANFNLYMSGVADWGDAAAVPLFVVPELRKRTDFHVGPFFASYFYRFNVTRPPFDDVRVRKAFFLATDRAAITTYVTRAGQQPAHSLVPPGVPGYEEARLPERNVAEARRLLAEAGYPGGRGFPRVEVLFNTSEAHKQIAEVLQQQWKEGLGVEVHLVNQEWKVFLATTTAMDYWISRGSWIGDYPDPNTFLDIWTSGNGNNRTGFSDPQYDALIERASRTMDPARRMAFLHQAEDWILNREMIVLPLYYYVVQNLYDERDFGGVKPNLLNLIDLKSVVPRRGHRGRPRPRHVERQVSSGEPRPFPSVVGSHAPCRHRRAAIGLQAP